jgi:hypothetical protein
VRHISTWLIELFKLFGGRRLHPLRTQCPICGQMVRLHVDKAGRRHVFAHARALFEGSRFSAHYAAKKSVPARGTRRNLILVPTNANTLSCLTRSSKNNADRSPSEQCDFGKSPDRTIDYLRNRAGLAGPWPRPVLSVGARPTFCLFRISTLFLIRSIIRRRSLHRPCSFKKLDHERRHPRVELSWTADNVDVR